MYFQSDEMSHGASQHTRAEYTRRPAWFSTGNDLSAARAGRLLDIVEQLRPRVALVLQSTQVPTEFDGEVGVVGKFVAYSWGREAEGAGVVVWLDRKVFPRTSVRALRSLQAGAPFACLRGRVGTVRVKTCWVRRLFHLEVLLL